MFVSNQSGCLVGRTRLVMHTTFVQIHLLIRCLKPVLTRDAMHEAVGMSARLSDRGGTSEAYLSLKRELVCTTLCQHQWR